MIKISTNILGTFALKDDKIVEKILFPRENEKDIKKIAQRLEKITKGETIQEEEELIKRLEESGTKELLVDNIKRFRHLATSLGMIRFKEEDERGCGENILEIGSQLGLTKEEILDLTKIVNLELTKLKLKKEITRDKILIQAINTLDELEEVSNLLMEHLREWYFLYFPELNTLVKKPEIYAKIVCDGDAEDIDPSLRQKIDKAKKERIGMDFTKEDINAIECFSHDVLSLYQTKTTLEKYIEKLTKEIAPNVSALTGPLLASRLISLAGGLEKLAYMPSSTIQILGAEEAFFKFLRTGKRPPKHGVIFQLPEIRGGSKNVRGKLSRTLAGKIAIAAKTDFYKGKFIGDKLREDFLKRVGDLKKIKKIKKREKNDHY
jgi:nucleolar protein 56